MQDKVKDILSYIRTSLKFVIYSKISPNLMEFRIYVPCQRSKYQTDQKYCRYEIDILCLAQLVYKCQIQNQKEVNHESVTCCKMAYIFSKRIKELMIIG